MGAATGLFLLLLSSLAQWNPWNEGQEPANIRSHLSQEPSSPGHHPSFHQFPSWDIPIMGASEEEEFRCPGVSGEYPDPFDCNRYFLCVASRLTHKACNSHEMYIQGRGCVLENVEVCPIISSSASEELSEETEGLQSSFEHATADFHCPRNSGQFPYIRDCSKYYKCMNGIVNLMSCPHGELFNTETSSCNPPRNVTCPPYESDKKVICYFSNERDHSSTHTLYPGDLNPYLCTHIHYSNAILDPRSLKIAIGNHQVDIIEQAYRRVTALRKLNPELKVLLTIGSSDSNTDEFSLMAADPQKRQTFIQHLISFLREHGFDGLEMDWEYPVCKTPLCSLSERGNLRDKENFALLIKEIRHAFDREQTPLLLAVKVSGSKTVIDLAYDVPTISRHSNYLVVMAFIPDGYTPSRMARHPGRMNPNPNVPHDTENVDFIMNYWRQKGAAPKKMILGIRAIGKGYILTDEQQNEVDSPITGMGHPENIPFPKVCQRIKQSSWTTMRDSDAGPYAYNRKHWMAYDDPKSVAEKTKYVIDNGYGGVMFCAAAHDDFAGECCKVKYPLLKGALYALTRKGMTPEMFECEG